MQETINYFWLCFLKRGSCKVEQPILTKSDLSESFAQKKNSSESDVLSASGAQEFNHIKESSWPYFWTKFSPRHPIPIVRMPQKWFQVFSIGHTMLFGYRNYNLQAKEAKAGVNNKWVEMATVPKGASRLWFCKANCNFSCHIIPSYCRDAL